VLAFFAGAVPVSALTISPARIELATDPGKSVSGEFLLINEQGATRTFYTSVQNFEAQGETGTPTFTSSDEGLASWVSVPSEITLGSGEQRKISYSVSVPADADAGGYFAAIFLSSNPPASSGQSQVSVGAKIGTLLLLRVSGDVSEGGAIASFTTKTGKWFYTHLPIALTYRFTNSGGDRVNPEGTVIVRNMFGIRAARFDANPTKGNVLPSSTRKFEVSWGEEKEMPKQFFGAVAHQWQHFALGVYHVRLSLSHGSIQDSDGMFVVVFPWQLMIVLGAIGVAAWFGGGKLIRRYNRWIIKKAQHARSS
jgi:hypothetical protein